MKRAGKLSIVGIGPGSREHMSLKACRAIDEADIVVGYTTYIRLLEEEFEMKETYVTGMRSEVERCRAAITIAGEGKHVAVVSSGDAGIYGMAGIIFEILSSENLFIETEVIPGITSASASASLLGAPLMHDFAVISLSDLLTDADLILRRVEAAASADFVICLYNPKSRTRVSALAEAREIILRYRSGATPVGIVRDAMRAGENTVIADLDSMLAHDADMTTTIIIGNSQTYVAQGKIITPRGYAL